ncbi:MAG: Crp/Fnr family transcriptional regulator [Pleomorphochaeta sp.]
MLKEKLQKISFLESYDEIDTLIEMKCLKYKEYEKNHTIREAQEACEWVDFVIEGTVIAYSLSENGNATTMFEFNKDSIIGANLILTGGIYPLTFYSKGYTEIISIKKCGIYKLLHNYDFTLNFFKSLSINSQNLNKKVFVFHRKTIRENLLNYFEEQSVIQGSTLIKLPISKKQLADYLGIQRQSLFRELKKLSDDKLIEINNREIEIL